MDIKKKRAIIKFQFVVVMLFIGLLGIGISITAVIAQPLGVSSTQAVTQNEGAIGIGIGAGLAIGLAGLGVGLGLGTASSAAIGAISENPEMFGRTIIFVAFIEGIGVFGFVISFLLYLSLGG